MNSRRNFLRNSVFGALAAPAIITRPEPVPSTLDIVADNELVFSTAGQERMRLGSDGSIGIGVSDPYHKLKVRTI